MYNVLTFENGLRLVYEKIPHVRSVSTGIWISTGSRNETEDNNGVSHFVEHMLFKGTEKRTAKDIAECVDSIGGQINAFTGKECTCYYTKTLDTHLSISLELLSDMLFNSKNLQKDVDIEKKVIQEEINMYEDSPEEQVHDLLSAISWNNHPLGYSILGTKKSLESINSKSIKEYLKTNYTPSNTVIAVAGNFQEDELIELIKKYFNNWSKKPDIIRSCIEAKFTPSTVFKKKDTEQIHVCIGFSALSHATDDIYSLLALNNILGGGMSSRLFQKVREEKGLVYSIYSYPSSYCDVGLFNIYAGMNPDFTIKVLKLIATELKSIKKSGVLKDELAKTKEQLKGNYILGLESTSSRMNSIGKSLLLLNKIHTQEEILQTIDAINMTKVRDIIDRVFDFDKLSFAAVGNVNEEIKFQNFLK